MNPRSEATLLSSKGKETARLPARRGELRRRRDVRERYRRKKGSMAAHLGEKERKERQLTEI